jgi:hypothetical protein
MSRGIHAPQYPTQAAELTTPLHMDEALASLSLRDPINNEHKSTSSSFTPSTAQQKKNKKEKQRVKEPDLEYEAFVAAQRQSRDERQVQPSNVEFSSSTLHQQSESTMDLKSCHTCGGSFTSAQYRAHFKSDWHRYNVKPIPSCGLLHPFKN